MEKNNSQKRRRRGPYKRTTCDLFENESLMVFNSSEAGSLHETHAMENTMHSSTDFLQCETGASQITKKQVCSFFLNFKFLLFVNLMFNFIFPDFISLNITHTLTCEFPLPVIIRIFSVEHCLECS